MNFELHEISYPSKDGIHNIHGEIYYPTKVSPKAILQISHGMVDYVERYLPLIRFFTNEGFIVAGNDHLGHGKSVNSSDEFGFFAKKGGTELVISDLHSMNRYLRHNYPARPVFMLGHSMGSFIARLYAEKHAYALAGLVIHGTSGPNPAVPLGKALASFVGLFCGCEHKSKLIGKIAFAGYNKRFPKEEGSTAWLSSDYDAVKDKHNDERGAFTFSVSGYRDLFTFLGKSNSKEWFKKYPKTLPTLIMSGDMDPVGNFGKGPTQIYKRLLIEGVENLDIKLYQGARHELFNEKKKDEIFSDLLNWLNLNL